MKKPTHLRHPGQMGPSTCLVHLLRPVVRDNANDMERDRLGIASVLTVIAVCYENTPEDRLCFSIQYALIPPTTSTPLLLPIPPPPDEALEKRQK
jgi:hypothetical protein